MEEQTRRERYEILIRGMRERFAKGKPYRSDRALAKEYGKAAKLTADCKMFWYLENESK